MAHSLGPLGRIGSNRLEGGVLLGAVGTLVLNLFTLALNFVLAVVLARALGSAGYGAYAFGFAWATVLAVLASLGVTPLVVRYVATYTGLESWGLLRGVVRRTNQVVAASSALVVAAAAAAGALLLRDSSSELLGPFLVGLALVPLIALTSLRQAALQGLHKVILGRIPDTVVLSGVFLVLVAAAAEVLDDRFSATWAVALNVTAAAIAFALGAVLLHASLPTSARAAVAEYHAREWIRGGLPLLAMSILTAVSAQAGTILLGMLDGAESAGTFSVANRIATFTGFVFLAATYPLYPNVARMWAVGERDAMQRLLTNASRVVLLASCCIAAILLVFASPMLTFFGPEFSDGVGALRVLVIGQLLAIAAGFGGLALVMTPHAASMTVSVGFGVVVNLAIAVAVIPSWGANGAAIAAAVGSCLSAVLGAWLAWRRLGVYAPALGRAPARSSHAGS